MNVAVIAGDIELRERVFGCLLPQLRESSVSCIGSPGGNWPQKLGGSADSIYCERDRDTSIVKAASSSYVARIGLWLGGVALGLGLVMAGMIDRN